MRSPVGFYVMTDTEIRISGLKDTAGSPVDDAVVTGMLVPKGGADPLPGSSITFDYVPASDGDYVAVLPASIALAPGREYDLLITAMHGGRTLTALVRRQAGYVEA